MRASGIAAFSGTPRIVCVSDVHGYLGAGKRALHVVGDAGYDPVVTEDDDGRLHWADNDYVLVVDGDCIDRGPASAETVRTVYRLQDEAPAGRVRYHVGNHEAALAFPARYDWDRFGWYCTNAPADERRAFLERARDGLVTVAFEGYAHTYSHAGSPDGVDVAAVNDQLQRAADSLLEPVDPAEEDVRQRSVHDAHDVFRTGAKNGRGPGAGPLWLDFEHLPPDAPPQVVGHTRHREPTRDGNVVCVNVVRENLEREGGEGVTVEHPDGTLTALVRRRDGRVDERDV